MWNMKFYSFDLDPMTLVLKLDLDIIKMYVCTKDEVPIFSSSKVNIWTDRQTDRLNWNYYLPHTRMVIIVITVILTYAARHENLPLIRGWSFICAAKLAMLSFLSVTITITFTVSSLCRSASSLGISLNLKQVAFQSNANHPLAESMGYIKC